MYSFKWYWKNPIDEEAGKWRSGYFFITTMMFTLSVHLFFLLKGVARKSILKLKKKLRSRKKEAIDRIHINKQFSDDEPCKEEHKEDKDLEDRRRRKRRNGHAKLRLEDAYTDRNID